MQYRSLGRPVAVSSFAIALTVITACVEEYRPPILGGTWGLSRVAGKTFSGIDGTAFTELMLQERVFTGGRVVSTVTHKVRDLTRADIAVDFNDDGRVDPVVGYLNGDLGVIQILLSYPEPGGIGYWSLTLDGGENKWTQLSDVEVGDIDGDGNLDIVAAVSEGVVYLHHPDSADNTHVMNQWGASSGDLELVEGTADSLSKEELEQIILEALGPGGNLNNWIITVKQGFTNVEIADFNGSGYSDIAASRHLEIDLEPLPTIPAEPIKIIDGSLQLLINPGGAGDGVGWGSMKIGNHERHETSDREGAYDLHATDVDGDGDLDLISTAFNDQNVQVAWFQNPSNGGTIDPGSPWTQHRIGSVRNALGMDVADVTGDGREDVIVASPDQQQIVLMVQPSITAGRGYDWMTVPIVTFEAYEPRSLQALDVDLDGQLEIVVGATNGAVRYFEPALTSPTDPWTGYIVTTYDPPGSVGVLGYGDVDGDNDVDLVAVVSAGESEDTNADRITWIRNEHNP